MALDLNVDVGSVFTGIGTLAKDLRSAFTGEISPEKKAEIELKLLELESQANMAQTKINEVQAASPSIFVSGARPAAMWVCVIGFAYTFLAFPILAWASFNFKWMPPPAIDATILMNLLMAMLGLGSLRSFDLSKGTRK
jgi:hypothetical protein